MAERLRIRQFEEVVGKLRAVDVTQRELDAALDDVEEALSGGVKVEEAVTRHSARRP